MSGALVLAYYKENGIFYIVSAYESGYEHRKDIPIGTPNDDEFAKLDKEWIENIDTQYVIDQEKIINLDFRKVALRVLKPHLIRLYVNLARK